MKVIRKDVFEFVVVVTEDEFASLKHISEKCNRKLEDMLHFVINEILSIYHEDLD